MKSISKEDLQELCDDHWEYIEQVIRNEYDSKIALPDGEGFDLDAYCRRVSWHYKTALAHGFKHGIQWIEKQIKNPLQSQS